jgi:glycosyltransferase involved in cell wall biosynthesis
LGLPQDRAIIGYIGRFRTMEMEKGIPELVQAMAHLRSVNGKEPLLLCVGGPLTTVPFYLDLALRCGIPSINLRFVDRVPNREVPFWMRAFDIAVAPFPYTEHYAYFMSPLKIFEYIAAGVPVVATDLPSIREVLHHGQNAWLVKPDDPRALAQGIHQILNYSDVAEKLTHQASRDVQSKTWRRRASEILRRGHSENLPLA